MLGMKSEESPGSFFDTGKADAAYRSIQSENAQRELLDRSSLTFRRLVISGYLLFLGLSSSVAIGIVVFSGRIFWIPIIGLAALLAAAGLGSYLLIQRFNFRISRLIDHIGRISKGDLSPITSVGKYRDEFTSVNVALNRMLDELNSHCATLMESHQMTAIGTLTAGVAHEINNPLNNIMLTAHTLLEEYRSLPDSERVEMITDLIRETERAQNIVRNLQDFARESESASEPLILGELIEEALKLAHNQAKALNAKIVFQTESHLPCIQGDRQQWKQVFLNLILNALEAIEPKGKISIRVEKTAIPGFVAIHVEDNGRGIPAHILPYIFNPFFTTKAPGKGTGLGLSVSKGIVTRHGGSIDVICEEGGYTRFTVTVPSVSVSSDPCAGSNAAGPTVPGD